MHRGGAEDAEGRGEGKVSAAQSAAAANNDTDADKPGDHRISLAASLSHQESKAKMCFQSFFMLMTFQPLFVASS